MSAARPAIAMMPDRLRRVLAGFACCGLLAAPAAAEEAGARQISEQDFFGELPVVLSVTRLAQPLDEVPGSVTVIDRELIRRSGARDVAEVLRLVPGFFLNYRNGALPQAVYHSGMDTYGARMQVYVDGRSVYSSFLFGDTKTGLRGLILQDIERIEVLRGSNSASYGANAFLGVVNIVTANAADTHGAAISLTGGNRGINDNFARFGWGHGDQHFRLSAARRSDRGFENHFDDRHESVFQLRADLAPSQRDELRLQAGGSRVSSGDGEGLPGNSFRTVEQGSYYLQGSWRRHLADDETIDLRFSHEREYIKDTAIVRGTLAGSAVSALNSSNGDVARTELTLQRSYVPSAGWRLAYGGEWRHELMRAPGLYVGVGAISHHLWRGFGTVEWRPHSQWLLQASGLEEGHSHTGTSFSPRFAANFHVTPDHTLRVGVGRSQRSPNFYELHADTRWYNLTPGVAFAPVGTQVPVLGWPYLSTGTVKPESLLTQELGYIGYLRAWNLRIDGRAFIERMNRRIDTQARTVPNPNPALPSYSALDFVNRPGPTLQGFEYQLDWRPRPGTRIAYSGTHMRSMPGFRTDEAKEAPHRSSSLTWLQDLPGNIEFSAIHTTATGLKWAGGGVLINAMHRLDLRLGKMFRIGATRGEASLTVQAWNDDHQVFKFDQNFDPRVFANLRFDF